MVGCEVGEPVGKAECSTVVMAELMVGVPDRATDKSVALPLEATSVDKAVEKAPPVSAVVRADNMLEAAVAALEMPTCCVLKVNVYETEMMSSKRSSSSFIDAAVVACRRRLLLLVMTTLEESMPDIPREAATASLKMS